MGVSRRWAAYSEERLLDMRLCDLPLRLEGSKIHRVIKKVLRELEDRDIRIQPHFWIGEEFFTPKGIPGMAIPYYLAHPRLERLEKKFMFEAEGSSERVALKIVRHEMGHIIDQAFYLTRRKMRQKLFGRSTTPYPETYSIKPFSRSYVFNLEAWYAQAHPDEDFAETFAVWLNPHSRWKNRYKKWPAYKKLIYMDELMNEISGKRPPNRSKKMMDSYRSIKKTLRQIYTEKREHYGLDQTEAVFDRDLLKLFSREEAFKKNKKASTFLRRARREARKKVSLWTGQYQYTIDELIEEMIERCQEKDLRLTKSEEETKLDFIVLLSVQTMNYLNTDGFKLAL